MPASHRMQRLPRRDRARRAWTTLLVVAAVLSVDACAISDVTESGRLGLTVDDAGRPVLLIQPCQTAVKSVTVQWGRTDDPEDDPDIQTLGEWRARLAPRNGVQSLSLDEPGRRWRGPRTHDVFSKPDGSYLIQGSDDDNTMTERLYVRAEDIDSLEPSESLAGAGSFPGATSSPRTEFSERSCTSPTRGSRGGPDQ